MDKVILLERLKEFTEHATADLLMPVRAQENCPNPPVRAAGVFKMNLPDSRSSKNQAPYIIYQIVTGRDEQLQGQQPQAGTLVRTVFCVYNPDEQEGGLMLLNLMERLRIALLRERIIGGQFQLDMQEGLESFVYPDNDKTKPFYLGEMISVWHIPAIKREYKEKYGGNYGK